jgi:hypothetical protein
MPLSLFCFAFWGTSTGDFFSLGAGMWFVFLAVMMAPPQSKKVATFVPIEFQILSTVS